MFWNTVYLDELIKASDGKKDDVPGHAYFRKLEQFIGHHYEVGDLYMEYTRGSCRKSLGKNIQLRPHFYCMISVTGRSHRSCTFIRAM